MKDISKRIFQYLAGAIAILLLAAGFTSAMTAIFLVGAAVGYVVVLVAGSSAPSYIPIAVGSALTGFAAASLGSLVGDRT